MPCTLEINGALVDGPHSATVLAGDSIDAYNDIEHPDRVAPAGTQFAFTQGLVMLPPHSLSIVKVLAK